MKRNDDNFNEDQDFSFNEGKKDSFDLPLDYFSSFEEKLRKKMEEENELKDFPLLSSIQRKLVFEAPANYFEKTVDSVEYKVELEAYPHLQQLSKPAHPEFDERYTAELETILLHRIAVAEELKPYQTLYQLDKMNPFSVSEAYFDTVAGRIKEWVYSVSPGRTSVWEAILAAVFGKRTAWAFGLVFMIGLAVYFKPSAESIADASDCKTLACLERQEILNTDAVSNFDEEQLMDLVDVNALHKQLNSKKQKSDSLSVQENNLQNANIDELMDTYNETIF